MKITRSGSRQVERFFDRHGGKAILVGRFVGLVRAIAPFLAGSSRMPFRRFLPYDVVGAGCGHDVRPARLHLLAQLRPASLTIAKQGAFALGLVIGVVVGLIWVVRHSAWRRTAPRSTRAADAPRSTAAGLRVLRPVATWLRGAGALLPGPADAGPARARADDAAGRRGGRLFAFFGAGSASPTAR